MSIYSGVTERALIARINRKLAHEDQKLRKSRGFYDQGRGPYFNSDLGEFFIQNVRTNFIVAGNIDLETLGRELGVI